MCRRFVHTVSRAFAEFYCAAFFGETRTSVAAAREFFSLTPRISCSLLWARPAGLPGFARRSPRSSSHVCSIPTFLHSSRPCRFFGLSSVSPNSPPRFSPSRCVSSVFPRLAGISPSLQGCLLVPSLPRFSQPCPAFLLVGFSFPVSVRFPAPPPLSSLTEGFIPPRRDFAPPMISCSGRDLYTSTATCIESKP